MTESYERSYYEIALTNRQVIVAFGLLLLCVAGAFLSGVWVGRESRSPSGDQVASQETGPAVQGGVTFFDADEPAAEPSPSQETATVAPEIDPLTPQKVLPLAEPSTARPRERPARPAAAPSQTEEAVTSEPTASSERLPPAAAELSSTETASEEPASGVVVRRLDEQPTIQRPEPEAQTAGEATEPPDNTEVTNATEPADEPAPLGPRTVDPPPLSELSVIQVFSTRHEIEARATVDRLKAGGFKAFLSAVQVDGQTTYRVRVGPFLDVEEAKKQAEILKRQYRLETWITH